MSRHPGRPGASPDVAPGDGGGGGGGGGRYRFGPLERRGLVAGWRSGQIASVAAGIVVAIVIVRGHPAASAVVLALGAVVASVAFAWWPVGGRTGEQWLPTVVRWGTRGLAGRNRRRAGAAAAGHCVGPDGAPCPAFGDGRGRGGTGRAAGARAARGSGFSGLAILGYRPAEGHPHPPMGVVRDARTRSYTAALSVPGRSFALLGTSEKERRVSSWASVLASFARERPVVHRVQWVATTVPDDGAGVREHLLRHAVLGPEDEARRSYATVLREAGDETCRHEVLVALQVRATGSGARAIRALGGGDAAACALLAREVASLRRRLSTADVPADRVLDDHALAAVARRALDGASGGARGCPPCGTGWPWPLVTEAEWDCLRADGSWHATYWVAEWPRVDVGPEFLAPLLLGSVRRTVAVVMEPLPPSRAARQAERARTADLSDAELRRRGGFLSTARRAREAELVVRREAELADGHASVRFSGYVTVTAPSRARLAADCEATEEAALQCRLELRRLYGDQERALTCTLPLARGLD